MAVSFYSPKYSFIQMSDDEFKTGCVQDNQKCLPVYALTDLRFQTFAVVSGSDKSWFNITSTVGDETITTTVYAKVCVGCASEEGLNASSFSWKGTWRKLKADTEDTWVGNFSYIGPGTIFSDLSESDCFKICFHRVQLEAKTKDDPVGWNTEVMACTETCFIKITDKCYTSVFNYNCFEDQYLFVYINETGDVDHFNRVRLPCYLRDMQLPSEEKTYTRSNGFKKKLFERVDEQYDLIVDWLPKSWHKRIKAMLGHDSITIETVNETDDEPMGISCNEKYQIDWPATNYQLAPAKTKVLRSEPLYLSNSNCKNG